MSTRTAEQTKQAAAFRISRVARSTTQHTYLVTRTDKSEPWPDNATLLQACDDGWDAVHERKAISHFGGTVNKTVEAEDARRVVVWVD